MIILISPAKTLDFKTKPIHTGQGEPLFLSEANILAAHLRKFNPTELSQLLSVSKNLAQLNFERYQNWEITATADVTKPAIYAYKGDVYQGLDPEKWNNATLDFAQKHLRIISGLYGYLRPLDPIKPYRLDMGTPLKTDSSTNLYDFWSNKLTNQIISDIQGNNPKVIINLASTEYSKSVDLKALKAKVITPRFLDEKSGSLKMISFYAKRARGLMASYLCALQTDDAEAVIGFQSEGYLYSNELSAPDTPTFIR